MLKSLIGPGHVKLKEVKGSQEPKKWDVGCAMPILLLMYSTDYSHEIYCYVVYDLEHLQVLKSSIT